MEINVIDVSDDDITDFEEDDDEQENGVDVQADEYFGWDEDELVDNEELEENFEEEPVELTEEAADFKQLLHKVFSHVPERWNSGSYVSLDNVEFPESYRRNTKKETKLLDMVENFRQQYVYIFPDRKPLLLNPLNECGVEKFVCSTIRPTCLPFNQMHEWQNAAEFVANYVDYILLEESYLLPKRLLSPTTVLSHHQGNCFEMSMLLVSLLIGVGYDAYAVSGYATCLACIADQSYDDCPLLRPQPEPIVKNAPNPCIKYTPRQPKSLESKYEKRMTDRLEMEKQKVIDEEQAVELAWLMAEEQPPEDTLFGQRVHSWVVVLPGKRDVTEPFFIDAVTGRSQPVTDPFTKEGTVGYLGVESVWNDKNYWVNMQDCSAGIEKMNYDLSSCEHWEYMLPSNKIQLPNHNSSYSQSEYDNDDDENDGEIEIHLEPVPWVRRLLFSASDFQMCYPGGHRTRVYKRARVDYFVPYFLPDGLVRRVTEYHDLQRTSVKQIKDVFEHRADKMIERFFDFETGWIRERYSQGSLKALKEHHYLAVESSGELSDRFLTYYTRSRADNLHQLSTTPHSMSLFFEDRDDFLVYMHAEFSSDESTVVDESAAEVAVHAIWKIVAHYARDESKSAEEDVREIVFDDDDCFIIVRYHSGKSKITFASRSYVQMNVCKDRDADVEWIADNYRVYLVDPNAKDLKMVDRYQLLVHLLKLQKRYRSMVSKYEQKLKLLLINLGTNDDKVELEVSIYDTLRDKQAKKYREMLERQAYEERMRRQEVDADYMGPFLAFFNKPETMTVELVHKLREMCLADYKQLLINRAEIIQAGFERERQELEKKQVAYQKQQTKVNEEEYVAYCSEAKLRLHVAELRLNRHKELAPYKFMALDQKIHSDPRFSSFFTAPRAGSVSGSYIGGHPSPKSPGMFHGRKMRNA